MHYVWYHFPYYSSFEGHGKCEVAVISSVGFQFGPQYPTLVILTRVILSVVICVVFPGSTEWWNDLGPKPKPQISNLKWLPMDNIFGVSSIWIDPDVDLCQHIASWNGYWSGKTANSRKPQTKVSHAMQSLTLFYLWRKESLNGVLIVYPFCWPQSHMLSQDFGSMGEFELLNNWASWIAQMISSGYGSDWPVNTNYKWGPMPEKWRQLQENVLWQAFPHHGLSRKL